LTQTSLTRAPFRDRSEAVGSTAGRPLDLLAIVVAAAITLAAAWIAMRLSITIEKRIGTTGILVLSRVLGMLLAAVAA